MKVVKFLLAIALCASLSCLSGCATESTAPNSPAAAGSDGTAGANDASGSGEKPAEGNDGSGSH